MALFPELGAPPPAATPGLGPVGFAVASICLAGSDPEGAESPPEHPTMTIAVTSTNPNFNFRFILLINILKATCS